MPDGSFFSRTGVQSCQGPHLTRLERNGGGILYQALYRKWRPRTFDDVVGQSHITDTLKKQVATGRTSHAYLFIGTRGTGKTTCAKILAKAVNCEHPVDGNPCNECRICRGIDDGSMMDVVEMDAASNNGVDNVRQLRDEAIFSPATANKRVYIVDEVHMLSSSAFNALLKILEEPPAHLMFILATTELNKVPATILSRCQRHSFKRLDTESIINRLNYVAKEEHLALTPEAASLIAGLSEGGMRDALSMLDQCSGRDSIDPETVYSALGLAGNRETAQLLRFIASHDTSSALTLFSKLWNAGKDPATLLGELSSLQRDLLLQIVAPKGGKELLSGGYDDGILKSFAHAFTAGVLISNIETIQTALAGMRSGQAKTVCELALITLCEPGLNDSLPMLRERVSVLEQLVRSGNFRTAAPGPAEEDPSAFCVPAQSSAQIVETEDAVTPFTEALPATDPVPVEADVPAVTSVPEPVSDPVPVSSPHLSGAGWPAVLERANASFPPGITTILNDSSFFAAELSSDTLSLCFRNEFANNMANRPDVLSKLGELSAEVLGHPVMVKVVDQLSLDESASPSPAKGNLDDLAKFDIVKFK